MHKGPLARGTSCINRHQRHWPDIAPPRWPEITPPLTLSGARTNSGGSRGGNYPLAVAFSLSRDIGTCQYPGGHHKYQSQRDDECNENPGIAHALFELRQRATASLDLTGSLDRAGRRVANLLIDAHGNRTGIEIRHERKILKRRPCSGGEGQDIRMVRRTQSPLSPGSTIRPRRTKGFPNLLPGISVQ